MMRRFIATSTAVGTLLALAGCITTGGGGTEVSGAAGGETSVGANSDLERCDQTLGTLAMDDGRGSAWWPNFYGATQVTTIEPLLRLAVQQSNCFVITSIGNARLDSRLTAITAQQRGSGEFRAGSKQQKGQRVAADYFMEPAIIINNSSTGQVAGAVVGFFNSTLGALAGTVQQKDSVVTLSLFDIRSQVQISAAEGSATATNYGAAAAAFGAGRAGALSGYTKTPEGKATVAAFTDAWNKMVIALRNYKAQDVKGGLGKGGTLTVN